MTKRITLELYESESTIQKAIVKWFRMQYPQHTILSIPNGAWLAGTNKYALYAKLKAEGLHNGASDLFIAVVRHSTLQKDAPKAGLWLECKRKGGKVSTIQDQFMADMRNAGYSVGVAYSFEQGKKIIEDYINGY
jgi:hypothetical protein